MDSTQFNDRIQRVPDWIVRLVADAITASVTLALAMLGISLVLGNPLTRIMDAYHQRLWMLLQFTMQMTLIIVLSSPL